MSIHMCSMCGRVIRWALARCFTCNDTLRRLNRVPKVAGEYQYMAATTEPVGQEKKS